MGLEDHASVQRPARGAEREAEAVRAEGKGRKEGSKANPEICSWYEQTLYPQHFHTILWEMKKKK